MKLRFEDIPLTVGFHSVRQTGEGGYKTSWEATGGIIYITDEDEDGIHTACSRQDFIDLCEGDEIKAKVIFDLCSWEHPETQLDQWDDHDDEALLAKKTALTEQAIKERG
jgi:hypothetical protein